MGLAIDGNEVHGIAKGGQAFVAMQENNDGSININGNIFAQIPKFNNIKGYSVEIQSNDQSQYQIQVDLSESDYMASTAKAMCGKKVIVFLTWTGDNTDILVTQPFLFGNTSDYSDYAVMDNIKPLICSDNLVFSDIKLSYEANQKLTFSGLPDVTIYTNSRNTTLLFGYQDS